MPTRTATAPRRRRRLTAVAAAVGALTLLCGELASTPSASADVAPTVRTVTDKRHDVTENWAPGTPALPVGAADLTRIRFAIDDGRVTVTVRVARKSPRKRDGQRVEVVFYFGPPNSEAMGDLRVTSDGKARAFNYFAGHRCTDVGHSSRPGRRTYVVSAPVACFGDQQLADAHVAVVRASITKNSVNRAGPIRGDVRVIRHLGIHLTERAG